MAITAADVLELRPDFKRSTKNEATTPKQDSGNRLVPEYESLASDKLKHVRARSAADIADRLISDPDSELAGRFVPSVN